MCLAMELAPSQTYEAVRKLIYAVAAKHSKRFGGEFDEIVSECHVVFCRVLTSFDPTKGAKFSTWLQWKLTKGLLSYARQQIKSNSRWTFEERNDLNEIEEESDDSYFSLAEFCREMSEDATTILDLIFDVPLQIRVVLSEKGKVEPTSGMVRDILADLGWCRSRVRKAFHEISEALRS